MAGWAPLPLPVSSGPGAMSTTGFSVLKIRCSVPEAPPAIIFWSGTPPLVAWPSTVSDAATLLRLIWYGTSFCTVTVTSTWLAEPGWTGAWTEADCTVSFSPWYHTVLLIVTSCAAAPPPLLDGEADVPLPVPAAAWSGDLPQPARAVVASSATIANVLRM